MADKANTYTFKQPHRAVFLNVYEAKPYMKNGKPKGDPKFSATFTIPADSPELAPLKAAMAAVAKEKWPGRNLSELTFPISNGEKAMEKAKAKGKDGAFYKGMVVLKTSSKYAPVLSVLEKGAVKALDTDILKANYKGKFYNGCIGAAAINLVPYEGDQDEDGVAKDGITAYIQSFLWVKDGERIGGSNPAETFKDYAGQVSGADPFAAGDDEIPF